MNKKIEIHIQDKISKADYIMLHNVLDHAHFNKNDVFFDSDKNELVIKLKRYQKETKAHKKFLWIFSIWNNRIPPTVPCILKIKDVDNYCINDDDPENPLRQEIITGGLIVFDNNLINIGSFCEHENPYDISIIPKRINITLIDEDLMEGNKGVRYAL